MLKLCGMASVSGCCMIFAPGHLFDLVFCFYGLRVAPPTLWLVCVLVFMVCGCILRLRSRLLSKQANERVGGSKRYILETSAFFCF